jgi:CelD/BcsL family acetyltransferase involved in cellulose biosynthesis
MIADAPINPKLCTEASPLQEGMGAKGLIVLDNVESLALYRTELENLTANLSTQNVAYEPWALFPLVQSCKKHGRFVFVLIFDSTSGQDRHLIGFFPFERIWIHPLVPLSCLRLWADPFNYLNARCDPLVKKGEEACVDVLLDWFLHGKANTELLNLRGITGDTEIAQKIEHGLSVTSNHSYLHAVTHSHLYRRQTSADVYIKSILSSKSQQTLRRYERRLQDLGPVEYKDIDTCENIDALADEFIDLESKGWKGQQGVAVESYGHRKIIKEILLGAHQRKRLSLLTLRIAGTLVAARCVFLAKPGSFLFKLTYDESELYAKRSPGLLLEMEAIRRLHSDDELLGNGIAWMDTCASPHSSIFSRSRSEALAIHRYIVARPRTIGSLLLKFLPHLLATASVIREKLSSTQRYIVRYWNKRMDLGQVKQTQE